MKVVVAAERPTPILWFRASGLESPTEVPASTLPAFLMAPVRANMASRRVVLPLWKGPTSAMHRGPRGLLTSCPIAASLVGARPMIGSAGDGPPVPGFWQAGKILLQCMVACTAGQRLVVILRCSPLRRASKDGSEDRCRRPILRGSQALAPQDDGAPVETTSRESSIQFKQQLHGRI